MTQSKNTNRLIHETSPYLLQHAQNPVNWFPWSDEALELARQKNKPIFLSIGYSACHWCHVMEKESFENEEIADILNRYFIAIKVDREERPDLDDIYMTAVSLMTGSGGWPLSVWLTPDLEPFFGGTYFPPEDHWGRAGFKKILLYLADLWHKQPEKLFISGTQITQSLQQLNNSQQSDLQLDFGLWHQAFQISDNRFDPQHGGFGAAPKFPHPMELSFLLRYYFHSRNKTALTMVEKTALSMARGGIFDQLGGGFHRYATDQRWLVPHFEKMLYDNALLAVVFLEIFQITHDQFYADIATTILDYVLREMTDERGGFYSSQDADSEGVEGKYFVWTKSEVEKILGKEAAAVFCDVYGITKIGNWEGVNILSLADDLVSIKTKYGLSSAELSAQLKTSRKILFEVRKKRVPPATDTKILTGWNSLMISALCKGFQVLGHKKYLDAAQKAVDFLIENNYIEHKILRIYRSGSNYLNGFLSDYTFLIAALMDMYESTFDWRFLERAFEINHLVLNSFWDRKQGGFFFTADDQKKIIVRIRNQNDNVIPSGNSTAIRNLLRIAQYTGDLSFKTKAEQAIRIFGDQIQKSPLEFAALLSNLDYFFGQPQEIVFAGSRETQQFTEMVTLIYQTFLPNKIIAYADPHLNNEKNAGDKLPVIDGKVSHDGQTKVYICENNSCQKALANKEEIQSCFNWRN